MAIRSWLRKLFASRTPRTLRKAPARSRRLWKRPKTGLIDEPTVYSDDAIDVLQDASGSDWYFANLSGGVARGVLAP